MHVYTPVHAYARPLSGMEFERSKLVGRVTNSEVKGNNGHFYGAVSATGLIRIDNTGDPAFWLEIRLSLEDVEKLVVIMRAEVTPPQEAQDADTPE